MNMRIVREKPLRSWKKKTDIAQYRRQEEKEEKQSGRLSVKVHGGSERD